MIAAVEAARPNVTVVTQNIDGMHQQAGSRNVIELHGSLWRLRCPRDGSRYQLEPEGESPTHCRCGAWLRPDIVWFGDCLDDGVVQQAVESISRCDLLISVGTSAVVWPSAGFPRLAREHDARCIEINPEETDLSPLYHENHRGLAGEVLPALFPPAARP